MKKSNQIVSDFITEYDINGIENFTILINLTEKSYQKIDRSIREEMKRR